MTAAVGQLIPPPRAAHPVAGAPASRSGPHWRRTFCLFAFIPRSPILSSYSPLGRQRHLGRGGGSGCEQSYNSDDSRDYSKRRVRNQKRAARDCAGCAAQPTHNHTALSPPPAAARRTPVNASTVAPRATGWRSGPGTRLYPKERGDNGLSAAPPREGGFGTARHERHPPSARAHAVAAGASFSATGTGQRARWLEWQAALRGFAAEGSVRGF